MKVVMAVGGYPTPDNPQSGVFHETAANQIAPFVDLEVVHFRYWKPGRHFFTSEERGAYRYTCLAIPTIPSRHQAWSRFHFMWYQNRIRSLLRKSLIQADIVHAVSAELGIHFSKLKEKFPYKLLTQFIGSSLVSELAVHRHKSWVASWTDNLDAASFNSHALSRLFFEYYPEFDGHRQTIYRGCNLDVFKPSSEEVPWGSKLKILFLGGLTNYRLKEGRNLKGGVDLLGAWEILQNRPCIDQCELLFAGRDATPKIISKFVDTSAWKNFKALGPLDKNQVLEAYKDSNIVVVPSLYDGLPNVTVEAQATGNLVIASRVGGIPESVLDATTGILTEAGNPFLLAEAIESSVLDKDKYKMLRKNGIEHIRTNFNA